MTNGLPGETQTDEVKRLEHVIQEIEIRESQEHARQSGTDGKLSGALAILPIIVGLATTAFFEMLPHAAKLGLIGTIATVGFVAAVVCFLTAALIAINGLWPRKNTYGAVGLRTILQFANSRTYTEQLKTMISERAEVVRNDAKVNERKLGRYMTAQQWTIAGLCVLVVLAMLWTAALIMFPSDFVAQK
jgi:hypothetical protein